ncbi:MAG: AmmeMemoRadiSam system radical SAM enzyme [Planctomycetaceae bacterium]|jgi:pyruvate formate lyase activating enzyme|nr:AmmeMemoRadiSam system radical SAM enzyme [Planctomycetaceae bacterium]
MFAVGAWIVPAAFFVFAIILSCSHVNFCLLFCLIIFWAAGFGVFESLNFKYEQDNFLNMNCTICPRRCFISAGKTGFCGVRRNMASMGVVQNNSIGGEVSGGIVGEGGGIFSVVYGKNTGFVVDPVEKKPLYHFYPGLRTLSFGSIGCNLDCKFCQNFSISRSVDESILIAASPLEVVDVARRNGCLGVAFTYNEPVIWLEYVIDIARAARQAGLLTIAVTNGYITQEWQEKFFENIDAANVDLKSFSDNFYREYCSASIEPVKETLCFLAKKNRGKLGNIICNDNSKSNSNSRTWFEVTTLLIPELNDSEKEVEELADWILSNLGAEVPLHFSAFRPADRMRSIPPTPPRTLFKARDIALAAGLKYVYTGNIDDQVGQSTFCPQCKQCVIVRDRFNVTEYHIDEDQCCCYCGQTIAGEFSENENEFKK